MNVRRTGFALYRLEGDGVLALSALTGAEAPVTGEEWTALCALPEREWAERELDGPVRALADRGLLVAEGAGGELDELRRRDERLTADAWGPLSSVMHFCTKLRGVAMGDPPITDGFVEAFGVAPPHFKPRMADGTTVSLELPDRLDAFDEAMAARKTSRFLDPSRALTEAQLGAIAADLCAVAGTFRQHAAFTAIHRSTPSASGLAPLEFYPVVLRVDGVAPGIYHYLPETHELELLQVRPVERLEADVRRWAVSQVHVGDAAVVFLVSARFGRMFWKYRWAAKAYAVLMMELGHHSQTFYLAAAHRGLAAFYTGAINDWEIEEALGLDSHSEGVLAMLGAGFHAAAPIECVIDGSPPFELAFESYSPLEAR